MGDRGLHLREPRNEIAPNECGIMWVKTSNPVYINIGGQGGCRGGNCGMSHGKESCKYYSFGCLRMISIGTMHIYTQLIHRKCGFWSNYCKMLK